jgi:two-component system CheB/CheR fusion protein
VEETIEDIKQTGIQHNIELEHKADFIVEADKDRIGQVIINLVTNAIKYSPDNKNVKLRIFDTEDDKAAVSVADKGIGIAKKDQKEIFKRFHRVEGKSEETYAGLGIGLFLANEIVERHGGELLVESEFGKGSVFTFTLPYATKNQK